jgi:hypothetical protein
MHLTYVFALNELLGQELDENLEQRLVANE